MESLLGSPVAVGPVSCWLWPRGSALGWTSVALWWPLTYTGWIWLLPRTGHPVGLRRGDPADAHRVVRHDLPQQNAMVSVHVRTADARATATARGVPLDLRLEGADGYHELDTLADGMHLTDLGMLGRQRTGRYHACGRLLVPIGMCSRSSSMSGDGSDPYLNQGIMDVHRVRWPPTGGHQAPAMAGYEGNLGC